MQKNKQHIQNDLVVVFKKNKFWNVSRASVEEAANLNSVEAAWRQKLYVFVHFFQHVLLHRSKIFSQET